jgi:glucose-1-phosphate cytidylyltransferase
MMACILCGGRGSRLGSITDKIPKALVEVRGNPIIWYSFLNLYHHGFREFIFPLGYKGEMIKEYVLKTFGHLDCGILFVDTGVDSTIASRMYQIKNSIPCRKDFFLINSDTIFDFNIFAMMGMHIANNALVTLSSVEVTAPWGVICMNGEEVVGFDRERKIRHIADGRINSGLAWLNKDALDLVDLKDFTGDFETAIYNEAIKRGRLYHYEIKGTWYPIDTQKDLDFVNREIK